MRLSSCLAGFNHLRRPGQVSASALWRCVLLGLLAGAALAQWLGLQAQQALEEQRTRQAQLQAELAAAQAALRQATEQQAQARHTGEQAVQAQGWRAERMHLLGGLQRWGRAAGAQLTQLQFDPQAWSVQGHIPAAQLRAWVQAQAPPGAGAADLLELVSEEGGTTPGDRIRFSVRWPLNAPRPGP